MQVTIPRWAQLVLIPIAVFLAVYVGQMMSHALFVFLLAALIALLLNPIVAMLRRVFVPRAVAVPLVYASFIAVVVVIGVLTGPLLVRQARDLFALLPDWGNEIQRQLVSLQGFLADRGVQVDLSNSVDDAVLWLQREGVGYAGTALNVGVGILGAVGTFLIVIIISFYMLVDGRRISEYLARALPIDDEVAAEYLRGLQTSFVRFMKGQTLLAFSVGLAAGLGVWVLGWDVVDIWPEGAAYAFLFGVWAGVTEVIPYVGPWLGALPPVLLALFHSYEAALWVALIFFLVQLLENHILVPNIMGTTVGVHPLVVIFALLAGAEVAGILGMLTVLPLLAMLKHTTDFFHIGISRAPWIADDGVTLVPAETASPGVASRPPADAPTETGHGEEIPSPAETITDELITTAGADVDDQGREEPVPAEDGDGAGRPTVSGVDDQEPRGGSGPAEREAVLGGDPSGPERAASTAGPVS